MSVASSGHVVLLSRPRKANVAVELDEQVTSDFRAGKQIRRTETHEEPLSKHKNT